MIERLIGAVMIRVIRGYRLALSPWIGNACRYWPTCSEYALDAIEHHGALRGGYLTLARLMRCHPYAAGGVDPVPPQFSWSGCRQCRPNARTQVRLTSIESGHEH